jgi:hypothetical protein
MNMWKLALPVSLLAVGTAFAVGVAPSCAGTFDGTYGFIGGSTSATETGDALSPNRVNFGSFSANGVAVDSSTNASSSAYQSTGWTTNPTTPDSNGYFQFVVTPELGSIMSIEKVTFTASSSTYNAPRNWNLRAFLGAPAVDTAYDSTSAIPLGASTTSSYFTNQTTITSKFLQNISEQVTFRLYGYNPNLDGGPSGIFALYKVTVEGTADPAPVPVPTPAAIPAIIGFGVGLWRKRKQQGAEVT